MKNFIALFLIAATLTSIYSCKDKDPIIENPEELITTLIIHFVPHGGGPAIVFEFADLDGPGGNDPVITTQALASNTLYHATLTVLNESETPVEDITLEIIEEGADHQFFFIVSGVQMTHTYDDQDENDNPIGVLNSFMTGDSGSGTLTVVLRHEPDKFAAGVKDGNLANAGGETDIEVEFPLVVE